MRSLRRIEAGVAPALVRRGKWTASRRGSWRSRVRSARPSALTGVLVLDAVVLTLALTASTVHATADGALGLIGSRPIPVALQPVTAASIDPEAPPPRRVSIERLGIESALVGLAVETDGTLEVPSDYDTAGWHRAGTAPGDAGPAVIVGHVDSFDGPAVFYRLRELQPGDRVTVDRVDGSRVVFEVYGQETVAKDAFPTERVYGATEGPELRLITCGGPFDEEVRRYTDNVVVYARQVVEPVVS